MTNQLILIIEDDERSRKLARDLLEVKGYRTIESESAEAGVDLARTQSPALILMDIQLPGMDAITAMKHLKANPNTARIPIIAITASAMTNNRQAMLDEGFNGYQTKPISLKEFLGEVERTLHLSKCFINTPPRILVDSAQRQTSCRPFRGEGLFCFYCRLRPRSFDATRSETA